MLHREIVLPPDAPAWAGFRARLWNAAEASETRKNATVGREFEIALPAELPPRERQALAVGFARELVARHGFAADVVLHAPHRMGNGLNYHAHILCSTRRLNGKGFGEKTRELDDLKKGPAEVGRWRARWAEVQNQALAERGYAARVDHRRLEAQGAEREPTRHKGPAITAMERRGLQTDVGTRLREEQRREMQAGIERAPNVGRLRIKTQEVARPVFDARSYATSAVHTPNDPVPAEVAERVQGIAGDSWELRSARHKDTERIQAAPVEAPERQWTAWEKEVERISKVALETWSRWRRAWGMGVERVRNLALETWNRWRSAGEKQQERGRAEVQNQPFAERGHAAQMDHRNSEAQEAEREPTRHKGPAITAMEHQGIQTEVGERPREEQRREMEEVRKSVLDASSDVTPAAHTRDEVARENAKRARAMAQDAQDIRRAALDKEAERVRAEAVEAWERWWSAGERRHGRSRDRDAGMELEGGSRAKRTRSRDGPEIG